jgi:hypothetical protein
MNNIHKNFHKNEHEGVFKAEGRGEESNITAEKLNRSNKSVMTCHEDLVMRKFKRKKKQQDKI